MKKLRLRIDDLTVESFPTASTDGAHGTVRAHDATDDCKETLAPPSCPVACETYDDTICGLSQACTNVPGLC